MCPSLRTKELAALTFTSKRCRVYSSKAVSCAVSTKGGGNRGVAGPGRQEARAAVFPQRSRRTAGRGERMRKDVQADRGRRTEGGEERGEEACEDAPASEEKSVSCCA